MTDLRRADLNLLVILEALLAERSATRAGRRLHLSQPAVSGALARLRDLFDDPLFVTVPGGLEPTGRALELAEPLGGLLADARALLGTAPGFSPAELVREFRLGLSDYAAGLVLPGLLSRVADEAPGVSLVVVDRVSGTEATELVTRRAVDLAVTVGTSASLSVAVEPLFTDGWRVVARAGHPLWEGELTARALAGWPALLVSPEGDRYGIGDRLLADLGLARRVVLTLPQFLAAPAALAGSDLVALLPARLVAGFASDALGSAPPPFDASPSFTVSTVWHRREGASPAHAWLRRCVARAAGGDCIDEG